MGKVYFFSDLKSIKIGYTSGNLKTRLTILNTGSPVKLYSLGYFTGTRHDEMEVHLSFANERFRYNGEWFRPSSKLIAFINEKNEEDTAWIEWNEKE